jgi:hypothetical protein
MENRDIRAKMLEDAFNRGMKGQRPLSTPAEYARLLGITEDVAFFNLRYLIKSGLLEGPIENAGQLGEVITVTAITPRGIRQVEGTEARDPGVNFTIIVITGPVNNSQVSIGSSQSPQVNKSPGATTVIGNQNFVAAGGFQPVEVQPYSQNFYGWLWIGRIVMRLLFHTPNHDTSILKWASGGLGAVFVITIIAAYIRGSIATVTENPLGFVFLVVVLVVALSFWETASIADETICPNCNYRLSYLRVRKTLTGQADTPRGHTDNYSSDYRCSNCGFERLNVDEIAEVEKSNNNG